ncbi:4-amino-4-deoxy-L-arabinose transferase, partial [bacterium]|nr:4-amino-4-deoxy-L-arabinose transferase [bacterium]
MTKKNSIIILIIIFLLASFFRFYNLERIPPGLYPDEAANGNDALEALKTGNFKVFYQDNNGREGLFINLISYSIKYLGLKPVSIRIISAIIGSLTIFGIYLLTKTLFLN